MALARGPTLLEGLRREALRIRSQGGIGPKTRIEQAEALIKQITEAGLEVELEREIEELKLLIERQSRLISIAA